jgi:hypothetical protein
MLSHSLLSRAFNTTLQSKRVASIMAANGGSADAVAVAGAEAAVVSLPTSLERLRQGWMDGCMGNIEQNNIIIFTIIFLQPLQSSNHL